MSYIYFEIAKLKFISNEDIVDKYKLAEIKNRFTEIIDYYKDDKNINFINGFIKNNNPNLPFNSETFIGYEKEHLILNFRISFQKPLFFIIDTDKHTVRNYINIEEAKFILSDKRFLAAKEDLSYFKNLNRLFKGIPDMNNFIDYYEEIIKNTNKLIDIDIDSI